MREDDPWTRPEGRETNPLWIAAGILGALFLGYRLAEHMQSKQAPPRPVAPAATSRAITPPNPHNARTTVPTYEPPPTARGTEPVAPTPGHLPLQGLQRGMFWSSAICSTQRVTINRIANLPTSLSWDQQVQVAEGRKQEALPLTLRRDLQGSVARRITRGRQTWRVQSARGAHPTTRRDRATAPVGLHTGPDQNRAPDRKKPTGGAALLS